jgi:hypothetical protein
VADLQCLDPCEFAGFFNTASLLQPVQLRQKDKVVLLPGDASESDLTKLVANNGTDEASGVPSIFEDLEEEVAVETRGRVTVYCIAGVAASKSSSGGTRTLHDCSTEHGTLRSTCMQSSAIYPHRIKIYHLSNRNSEDVQRGVHGKVDLANMNRQVLLTGSRL